MNGVVDKNSCLFYLLYLTYGKKRGCMIIIKIKVDLESLLIVYFLRKMLLHAWSLWNESFFFSFLFFLCGGIGGSPFSPLSCEIHQVVPPFPRSWLDSMKAKMVNYKNILNCIKNPRELIFGVIIVLPYLGIKLIIGR